MIEVNWLSKYYNNGEAALLNVNLKINSGEFVFIVGPSGAGKSTLIKMIFREELPSSGKIFFLGHDTSIYRQRELLKHRQRMGMVFQDFRLLKAKTVFENVAFALEVMGRPKKEIRQRVPAALDKVGLAGKGNSFPGELSGGEQQRVGIARAIVKNPLVILADEPTGNLDRETSGKLMELFEEINLNGTTVIVATHAWEQVDAMKKRVVALENGRLMRDEYRGSYSHEL